MHSDDFRNQVAFRLVPLDCMEHICVLGVTPSDWITTSMLTVPHLKVADRNISAVIADGDPIEHRKLTFTGHDRATHIVVARMVGVSELLPFVPTDQLDSIDTVDRLFVHGTSFE